MTISRFKLSDTLRIAHCSCAYDGKQCTACGASLLNYGTVGKIGPAVLCWACLSSAAIAWEGAYRMRRNFTLNGLPVPSDLDAQATERASTKDG